MSDSTYPPRQWVYVMPRHDDDGELARRLENEANTKLEAFFQTVEGQAAMILAYLGYADTAEALFKSWNERTIEQEEREQANYDLWCEQSERDYDE